MSKEFVIVDAIGDGNIKLSLSRNPLTSSEDSDDDTSNAEEDQGALRLETLASGQKLSRGLDTGVTLSIHIDPVPGKIMSIGRSASKKKVLEFAFDDSSTSRKKSKNNDNNGAESTTNVNINEPSSSDNASDVNSNNNVGSTTTSNNNTDTQDVVVQTNFEISLNTGVPEFLKVNEDDISTSNNDDDTNVEGLQHVDDTTLDDESDGESFSDPGDEEEKSDDDDNSLDDDESIDETYVIVNGTKRNFIEKKSGLHTMVLHPNGTFKNEAFHDVCMNEKSWNAWAVWINKYSCKDDLVAVTSTKNRFLNAIPRNGAARSLLKKIGSNGILVETNHDIDYKCRPMFYQLLFVKGKKCCMETNLEEFELEATYHSLLNLTATVSARTQYPVLQNNWVSKDYSLHPTYYKDKSGTVHLTGYVEKGSIGTPMFTLLSGYRPSICQFFPAFKSFEEGRIDILPDGQVVPFSDGTADIWFSLEDISFRVEN